MYESLLFNIKNKLALSKRTNAELKSKLDEMFDLNNAEFKKMARMYDGTRNETMFDKMNYELQQIENLRKLKYGDDYVETKG